MIGFFLKDGWGRTKNAAKVSSSGELITGPVAYNTPISIDMTTINTSYNIAKPRVGFKIVIDLISLYADKSVGTTDSTIIIYEATSAQSTTVTKQIFKTDIPKNGRASISGAKLLVNEGVWLNIKCNDNNVFALIGVYYINAIDKDGVYPVINQT